MWRVTEGLCNLEWQLWEQQKEQKTLPQGKNDSMGQKLPKGQKHIMNRFTQWALQGGQQGHKHRDINRRMLWTPLWDPQANSKVSTKTAGLTRTKLLSLSQLNSFAQGDQGRTQYLTVFKAISHTSSSKEAWLILLGWWKSTADWNTHMDPRACHSA